MEGLSDHVAIEIGIAKASGQRPKQAPGFTWRRKWKTASPEAILEVFRKRFGSNELENVEESATGELQNILSKWNAAWEEVKTKVVPKVKVKIKKAKGPIRGVSKVVKAKIMERNKLRKI